MSSGQDPAPARVMTPDDLFRQEVFRALVAMIPEVRSRSDLGFRPQEREDALMEAIVRLLDQEWSAGREIDPTDSISRLARAYAARILRNQLLGEYRRRSSQRLELDPTRQSPEALTESQRGLLAFLLEGTREEDVRLLMAYFRDNEAFLQESEEQGLKEGTARVRVHRALKRLRERGGQLEGGRAPGEVEQGAGE